MNCVDYFFETSHALNKDVVVGNSEQISYGDLFEKVNRIAYTLSCEAGEDQKIILVSENSVFFIAAYLGIIKSGNVCVPLNPSVTPAALTHIVNQCEATAGFFQKRSLEKFKHLFNRTYDETTVDSLPLPDAPLTESADFDENRLAEILFTSGSTALPKGVMLSHQNLIANTESIIEYLELTENDRIEVVLPFYYCYGLSLLHTHLRVGGSMVFNNTFMMLNTVVEDLKKYECTGFAGVPSHYQILLRKSGWFRQMDFLEHCDDLYHSTGRSRFAGVVRDEASTGFVRYRNGLVDIISPIRNGANGDELARLFKVAIDRRSPYWKTE